MFIVFSIIRIDIRCPALLEAPFFKSEPDQSTDPMKFPVIVFSHGLHSYRTLYSGICCDLASHGYIVAAIEHKDRSACLTLNRIPGPGVTEGDYDRYINEWIPVLARPIEDFPLRSEQVNYSNLM